MNLQGISLVIVSFIGFASIVLVSCLNLKYNFYFLSNEKFAKSRRNILVSICIFCIAWFLAFRFGPVFLRFVNDNNYFWNVESEDRNADISVILSLDLCGLLCWLLPLTLLLPSKFNGFKKIVSVFSLLGGCVTFFGSMIDGGLWDIRYLLFNIPDYLGYTEPLFFMMHAWMIGLSLYYLSVCSKFNIKEFLGCFAFIILFIIYIVSMRYAFDVRSHVTGLVEGDYFSVSGAPGYSDKTSPSYHVVAELLKFDQSIWWVCPIVMYLSFGMITISMIGIKNLTAKYIKRPYDVNFDITGKKNKFHKITNN